MTCADWLEISPIELASSCTAADDRLDVRGGRIELADHRGDLVARLAGVRRHRGGRAAHHLRALRSAASRWWRPSRAPPRRCRRAPRAACAGSPRRARRCWPRSVRRWCGRGSCAMARATSPISSRPSRMRHRRAFMSPPVSSPTPATRPRIARMIERDSDQANSSASSVAPSVTPSALHSLVLKPSMRTMQQALQLVRGRRPELVGGRPARHRSAASDWQGRAWRGRRRAARRRPH